MAQLPITRMTLYKHGVGFFERRSKVKGEEVELSFRVTEMNDILKSLTAMDWGGGKVLGIDYATPQSREERLAGCSIRLDDQRSLRDLISGLRGRRVQLITNDGGSYTGTLLGLDEPADKHPLTTALVSLLMDDKEVVQTLSLEVVTAVEIYDERGAADLRFFLETALTQEQYRNVTIRLDQEQHDLSVSYIAPAPTWRVSYRLVLENEERDGDKAKALLLGWGIFDNRLEEDLKGISLSLVAGMPISFVYDLYTPFTPERPVIKEEARVTQGPVEFEEGMLYAAEAAPAVEERMVRSAAMPAPARYRQKAATIRDMAEAQDVSIQGEALGELFQYNIQTPVTVKRGHSAMVPIVSAHLTCQKDLIYNSRKVENHPVATLRMKNESSLTLERGPVTVLESGNYVGEALLPFTASQGEIVVPYAVELGVKIREVSDARREIYRLSIRNGYLLFEEWDVQLRTCYATNKTGETRNVLIEHRQRNAYTPFETPAPVEKTDEFVRYKLEIPPWKEGELKIQEKRLMSRREEFKNQSFSGLRNYLSKGLIDKRTYDLISDLLKLYDVLAGHTAQLEKLQAERKAIYKTQEQIQGNMAALTQQGKEQTLRAQYVDRLEETEKQLRDLEKQEMKIKQAIIQTEKAIEQQLEAMK